MRIRTNFSRRLAVGVTAGLTAVALGLPALPAHAAPAVAENIIVMIGDGMGYNTLDLTNLHLRGTTGYQVNPNGSAVKNEKQPGFQSYSYVGMSTYAIVGAYNGPIAWTSTAAATGIPTDSAAAGTAMASGHKTFHGIIGMTPSGKPLPNITERAKALGKAAGVVSSVPYSHATPAAYVAHEISRNNYHNITNQMINSKMDVVIGAGHPFYDDNNKRLAEPDFKYISAADWNRLEKNTTGYSFIEKTADFKAIAEGKKKVKRLWGVPQVASTLQQERSSVRADAQQEKVGETPFNKVPNLTDLSLSALNVLNQNPRGYFLMVEGGAIDWAGHANQTARSIEETMDFMDAVEAVSKWVEKNSSWDKTLLIITADHETGFINGPSERAMVPLAQDAHGNIQIQWLSDQHTNQLVPFFVKGAGAQQVLRLATSQDPYRGAYMDNIDFPQLVMHKWWIQSQAAAPKKAA
ncbi:MAG TPA: alkaline phosphatase [Corynebacteriales bacterium]|nr:alkaline phosphatase [Mycobacteriales bacterium]